MTQEFSDEECWMGAHHYSNESTGELEAVLPLDRADLEAVCEKFNRLYITVSVELLSLPLFPQIRLSQHGKHIAYRDHEQKRWELAAQPLDTYTRVTGIAISEFDGLMRRCAREKARAMPAT